MRSTVVNTAEFPVSERPGAWAGAVAMTQVPQRVTSLETGTFKARIEMMPLGAGQFSVLSSYACVSAQRTARHVRQCDPEMYHGSDVVKRVLAQILWSGRGASPRRSIGWARFP